jgi:hypothetical protein
MPLTTASKRLTATESNPQSPKSLHRSNVRHHPRHIPYSHSLPTTPLFPKITPKPSHHGLCQKTRFETPHSHGINSPEHSLSIHRTCVTIPVTHRRCLPSLVPPYALKSPPNRHITAYAKKTRCETPHTRGIKSPERKISPYIERASPSPSHTVLAFSPSYPLMP